ncbi:hypothetical protein KIL84_015024 [Mauremys mutica]|uniref:Uncharacterized protein n=1 Tax=Mauremys mutica TaxID=74926 RepID=A0A9D4B7R7_9SAUR|nr:hypothetical protein KIL84_015024 [Mauremys mutica]
MQKLQHVPLFYRGGLKRRKQKHQQVTHGLAQFGGFILFAEKSTFVPWQSPPPRSWHLHKDSQMLEPVQKVKTKGGGEFQRLEVKCAEELNQVDVRLFGCDREEIQGEPRVAADSQWQTI